MELVLLGKRKNIYQNYSYSVQNVIHWVGFHCGGFLTPLGISPSICLVVSLANGLRASEGLGDCGVGRTPCAIAACCLV